MKNFLAPTILAIGILLAGLFIGLGVKYGIAELSSSKRVVNVRGLAEREVKADKVTWPIVFNVMGNDLPSIYNKINEQEARIKKFLADNNIATSEISCDAPSVFDRMTNNYSNTNFSERYNVTCTIVVTSTNVDLVDSLIKRQGELMREGISLDSDNYSNPVAYEFTGLNDIKPEMIAEATRNARLAAQKFADDSESKLGKIRSATQGQFSIEDRDKYTPQIKQIRIVTYVDYSLED